MTNTTSAPGTDFGTARVDLPSGGFFQTTVSRTTGGHYFITSAQYDAAGVYEGTHRPVKVTLAYATQFLIEGGIWPATMRTYGSLEEVA